MGLPFPMTTCMHAQASHLCTSMLAAVLPWQGSCDGSPTKSPSMPWMRYAAVQHGGQDCHAAAVLPHAITMVQACSMHSMLGLVEATLLSACRAVDRQAALEIKLKQRALKTIRLAGPPTARTPCS